jgi:hypothetical protein
MVALSANGGGKIFLRAGSYYPSSAIVLKNTITLEGEGKSTVLHTSSTTYGIDAQSTVDGELRNFKIIVVGAAAVAIYGYLSNIICDSIDSMCADIVQQNFAQCKKLNNCSTLNGIYGYNSCAYLSNCTGDYSVGVNNTVKCYNLCNNATNCSAKNSYNGFYDCYYISSCTAESNVIGFNLCRHVSVCYATLNTNGFVTCVGITNCYAYKNTTYGFNGCTGCLGLYALSHGSAGTSFQVCSPNYSLGGSAVANNTLGGCNHYIL